MKKTERAERAKKVLTHRDLLSERSGVDSRSKLSLVGLEIKVSGPDLFFLFFRFSSFYWISFFFSFLSVRFRASGRHVNTSGRFRFRSSLHRNDKVYGQQKCCTNRTNDLIFIRSNKKERMNETAPPPSHEVQ